MVTERETEARNAQDQTSRLQAELTRLRQDLQDKVSQEDALRQQMTEKEEKTRKAIVFAKQKINQLIGEWLSLILHQIVQWKHYNVSSVLQYCSSAFYLHLNFSPNISNLNLCPASKDQLQKENEELKQQREELEVRVSALKSQYEGRLSRQERELRDLRGQQERQEQRDEPPEAGPSKVRVRFIVFTSQAF